MRDEAEEASVFGVMLHQDFRQRLHPSDARDLIVRTPYFGEVGMYGYSNDDDDDDSRVQTDMEM